MSSTYIADLIPEMQDKVQRFLSLVKVEYVVTSTLRTLDEQIALFAQGRASLTIVNLLRRKAGLADIGNTDNSYTVTNCDGITNKSKHQEGKAIDVVPAGANGEPTWPSDKDPRWERIALCGEAVGLEWGGRWSQKDLPHYQQKEA